MEREGLLSTDSEVDLVAAAKQARQASAAQPSPRPPASRQTAAPGPATARASLRQALTAAETDDSESEPFDLIAAAKKQSAASATAATDAAAAKAPLGPAGRSPASAAQQQSSRGAAQQAASESSDGELDMVTLAKQRGTRRAVSTPSAAPAAGAGAAATPGDAAAPTSAAGSGPSPSRARAASSSAWVQRLAEPKPLPGTAGAPAAAVSQAAPQQVQAVRSSFHASGYASALSQASPSPRPSQLGGSSRASLAPPAAAAACSWAALHEHEVAASQLPLILQDSQAAVASIRAQSQSASLTAAAAPAAAAVPVAAAAPSSESHTRPQTAPVVASAPALAHPPAPAPAPASPGVALASLADLGDVVSAVVGDLASSLKADIGRLEAGWQDRWAEQAAGTADLRQRLEGLQAASNTQAEEVAGHLQGVAAELALQRSRLEAVERAQQAMERAQQAQQAQAVERAQQAQQATERAQQAQQAAGTASASPAQPVSQDPSPPAAPPAPAPVAAPVVSPHACEPSPAVTQRPPPASAGPPGAGQDASESASTVDAILRRLSLLETRVGAQLQQIEAACTNAAGSPRSAPVSPLKSGPWGGPPADTYPQAQPQCPQQCPQQGRPASRHADSRASQAAAVAAAAVYGSTSQATECSCDVGMGNDKWATHWHPSFDAAMPGSPRIQASGLVRPASAAAAGYCSGPAGPLAGSMRSPSGSGGGSACKRSKAVEQQVAETHAIIAGIQGQIAAIKSSLSLANGELDARRIEAHSTAQRLEQLERTDRHMVKVEAANLAGTCALERRVRSLEEQVAAAARQAATGGMVAREAAAALAALEWRVNKSSDATIGTIKGLEARQDKQRTELHSVATTATLAEAKTATLAAEVARLQRRIHGPSSSPLRAGCKAEFRLYG